VTWSRNLCLFLGIIFFLRSFVGHYLIHPRALQTTKEESHELAKVTGRATYRQHGFIRQFKTCFWRRGTVSINRIIKHPCFSSLLFRLAHVCSANWTHQSLGKMVYLTALMSKEYLLTRHAVTLT
jgi:hypothetical protein